MLQALLSGICLQAFEGYVSSMCILQPFCGIGKGVLLPLTIFIGCEDILVENCVGWTDCTNVFLADPWSAERFVNLVRIISRM